MIYLYSKVSILVNDTMLGFFQSSRGLRKGDPFLPYTFVIAMEALSYLLKRARFEGFLPRWHSIVRAREGVKISNLLFANDTVASCKSSQD